MHALNPLLPPTAWELNPDRRSYLDGALGCLDGTPLTAEVRKVGETDVVCLRPTAEDYEMPVFPDNIPLEGQPIYLLGPEGDLRPFTYYGLEKPRRNRFDYADKTFTASTHPNCPACKGRGTTWMTRAGVQSGGCHVCGHTFRAECAWVVVGHEKSTGIEWERQCAETQEEAGKLLRIFKDDEEFTFRVMSRMEWSPHLS